MPGSRPVLTLLLALCAAVDPAGAQPASGTFSVNINFTRQDPTPSSCATLSGPTARVTCLTSSTPSFSAPGRPDAVPGGVIGIGGGSGPRFETAASVPAVVGTSGLGATAGGSPISDESGSGGEPPADGPGDGRTLTGASFEVPPGSKPPEELEVSF